MYVDNTIIVWYIISMRKKNKVDQKVNEIDLEIQESIKNLAMWIRMERKKANLSQKDLSFKAGLSQNHVFAIEVGKRCPNMRTFFKVCRALNLNPGKLFEPPPNSERQQDKEVLKSILNKYILQ